MHVRAIGVAELRQRFTFLAPGESQVHEDEDREHRERDQGGPLEQEPDHDQDEAYVLRMTDPGVGAGRREGARTLGGVQHTPR